MSNDETKGKKATKQTKNGFEEADDRVGKVLVQREIITEEQLSDAIEHRKETGTPLWRTLINKKYVLPQTISDTLKFEFHPPSARVRDNNLGQLLYEQGAVTDEQLTEALKEQQRTGRLLGKILVEMNFVKPEQITEALGKQSDITFVDLSTYTTKQEVVALIPETVARDNKVLPLKMDRRELTVAVADPRNVAAIDKVSVLTGLRVKPVVADEEQLMSYIDSCYRQSAPAEAAKTNEKRPRPEKADLIIPTDDAERKAAAKRLKEIQRTVESMPVVKLVSSVVEGAINSRATDVHLDPQGSGMRIRYRVDGLLYDVMTLSGKTRSSVISRLKIMCNMDITETRHPQDGHFSMEMTGRSFDVRVATVPTHIGEKMVLRLLDPGSLLIGLKQLGIEPEDETVLTKLIGKREGMLLVTGPTGSGKTTTLYAILNQLNILTENIITLEEPVEYQLEGINQVQVDTHIDLTFAKSLRAALRLDPDTLMVGEIRDDETASIAIRAAMTGHRVLSTMHTNSAPEAISALLHMNVRPYLIATSVNAVIAQRLVRKICPECREKDKPGKALLGAMGLGDKKVKFFRGSGCANCHHTGYYGRTAVYEIFEITPAIKDMIVSEVPIEQIADTATDEGMKSLLDRGLRKVTDGITTGDELVRVLGI